MLVEGRKGGKKEGRKEGEGMNERIVREDEERIGRKKRGEKENVRDEERGE